MSTDRTRVVSIRPELASPQMLLDARNFPKNFSRRDALDRSYYFRGAIPRYRLDEEMHMVLVCTDLQKFDLVALRNLEADRLQNFVNRSRKNRPAVLFRKHQMIE